MFLLVAVCYLQYETFAVQISSELPGYNFPGASVPSGSFITHPNGAVTPVQTSDVQAAMDAHMSGVDNRQLSSATGTAPESLGGGLA